MPVVNSQATIQSAQNQNKLPEAKQPQIEVTQMKFTPNQYPFVLPINGEQVNSHQIVQGVPVQNTLFDLERNNTNQNQYGDDLRLQKYELEKQINNNLVSFIRHNKISMVFMIILIVSYAIQIATQGSQNDDSNDKKNQKSDSSNNSSVSNNVYYFILDYLFWFGACIAAIKSQSNYNLKYINVYLGFMIFSLIPQTLGYADLGYRNKQSGQTTVLIINILACIIEFLYKFIFGIIKAIGIRSLYAKHTSQFQGMQILLYNKPVNSQGL
ncbi:hypothetical protein ABPG72_008301 [Tetrahymena utriculariae]